MSPFNVRFAETSEPELPVSFYHSFEDAALDDDVFDMTLDSMLIGKDRDFDKFESLFTSIEDDGFPSHEQNMIGEQTTKLGPKPSEHEIVQERSGAKKSKSQSKSRPPKKRLANKSRRPKRASKKTKRARKANPIVVPAVAPAEPNLQSYGSPCTLDSQCSNSNLEMMLGHNAQPRPNFTLGHLLGYASPFDTQQQQSVPVSPTEKTPEYNHLLQKLSESMERSDLSRRQLTMQRASLVRQSTQEMASVLGYTARQKLEQRVSSPPTATVSACPVSRSPSPSHSFSSGSPNSGGSLSPLASTAMIPSNVAAFLSGSRGTLTNGLEQSRRQLKMYVGHLNNMM